MANAYRTFGYYMKAQNLFERVEVLYREKLSAGDYRFATLYNNWAFVYRGFQFKHHVLFSHTLNNCIRRQLLPADISQFLWAVIIRRYRLSATSVRILDIIKMSG